MSNLEPTVDELLERMKQRHDKAKEKEQEEAERQKEELRQAYIRRRELNKSDAFNRPVKRF